jgi:hypothetical protein
VSSGHTEGTRAGGLPRTLVTGSAVRYRVRNRHARGTLFTDEAAISRLTGPVLLGDAVGLWPCGGARMATARESLREFVELAVVSKLGLDGRAVVAGDRGHRGMCHEVKALLRREVDGVRDEPLRLDAVG